MADTKISALAASTTPLAGTEVLPIVQSGATVKVATNDLTVRNIRANATTGILQITGPAAASTRVATVPDANWTAARTDAAQSFTGDQTLSTGNLVVSNGKGIDFSATPNPSGMTSELFADYEEGTWTPTDVSGAGLTFAAAVGTYTKIGRMVYLQANISYPTTGNTNAIGWGTFPYTAANGNHVNAIAWSDGAYAALNFYASTTAIYSNITSASGNLTLTNNLASGKNFRINIFYSV
jgi:hypothetical protein